ncbi:hypothetical protein [Rathayibacter soli]|uniref:hypothetical protein n=1 Tax=Rathayibacter soli TaxID=3144168 RepID=UPI0027E3E2EF|nr:hypothetical protein [Glaciibacter superstes]
MPTFHDPVADGEATRQALHGLAHATRSFDDPSDTSAVIGDLLAGVQSLHQALEQLASTHLSHRARAFDDHGNHPAGAHAALAAADELRQAGTLLDTVEARLDRAAQYSGAIAWHPTHPGGRDAEQRWVSVVFLQGEEADAVLEIVDRDGPDAAITHLAGWDCGDETTQAAMVNGYVYDTPPSGALDREVTRGEYVLTYNQSLGHVSLLRQLSTPSDPALREDHLQAVKAVVNRPAQPTPDIGGSQRQSAAKVEKSPRGTSGSEWFAPSHRSAPSGRSLSM